MLKIFGAVLVMAASGFAGLAVAKNYADRPRQLRMIRTCLQMLETEILYTQTPLSEAMKRIGERADQPVSLLFSTAAQLLGKKQAITAARAWEQALDKFTARAALKDSDIEVLRMFGLNLGCSDRSEQQKNLMLFKEQLRQEEYKAESERTKNERLYRNLGFLLGAVLILVFY